MQSESELSQGKKLWDFAGLAVVLALALFVYRGALDGFFVQDDFGWLHDSRFTSLGAYLRCFFQFNPALTYRPLSQEGFFWLGQSLFGMWPAGFHAMSLLLHLFGASLVFVLLRLFFGRIPSLAGALFFAIHSAHFRSVYWISAAPEPMALVFYLTAILAFVLFDRSGSRKFYWMSLAGMMLGLMSKESILTLPAVLAAYSLSLKRKRLILWSLPFFAISAAYCVFRALSHNVSASPYPLTFGAQTARTVLTYLSWTSGVSESLLKLSPGWKPEASYPLFGLLALVTAVALFFKSRDRRLALWAIIWFLFALQPVLYFSEQIYPYYLGPALPAFSLLLASALPEPSRGRDWKRWAPIAALAGVFLWCSYRSVSNEGGWWNDRSFVARDVVTQMPEIARQVPPGRIVFLFGFGPTEFGAMQNDAALSAYGYRPDRFILVGLDRDTICHLENLKKHGGLGDYYCFLYTNGKLQSYTDDFRLNPDSFIRLKPVELLPECSPEISSIQLEHNSGDVAAGSGTAAFRVVNLDAKTVDVLYTLNGALMPVVTNWKLQPDGTAEVFVDRSTPKGVYAYRAVRDSADADVGRWLPACVEITVR